MTQKSIFDQNLQKTSFFANLKNYVYLIAKFPRLIKKIKATWRFAAEESEFKALGGKFTQLRPMITEYGDQAGSAQGHYFHQDLLVASLIAKSNPIRHIDVASRIDGFVAHVAAFRPIEILDVRALQDTGHENIGFLQANLMDELQTHAQITDSLSCLHAIEHFGLGRYNDPIDPNGHIKGFKNLIKMLKLGGILYISFPIAERNQIQFNAHRIFHPKDIFSWTKDIEKLTLQRFDYVDDAGSLHSQASIDFSPIGLSYGCGIYTFQKISQ